MEQIREQWNDELKILRGLLESGSDHPRAVEMVQRLHAQTHTAAVGSAGLWSFQDEVLSGLDEAALRKVPARAEHSVVWMLWHIARCEDITMNLLVSGAPQVLTVGSWAEKVGGRIIHTGNALDVPAVSAFSAAVNVGAVLAYRQAVGERTQEVMAKIQPDEVKRKVEPARMQQVTLQEALPPEAQEVYDFWASRTIAGLLLMPATRHNFVHLNEALRMKSKLR